MARLVPLTDYVPVLRYNNQDETKTNGHNHQQQQFLQPNDAAAGLETYLLPARSLGWSRENHDDEIDSIEAQQEAVPDGGRDAWLVLLGAFCLTFVYCGFNFAFGVFQAELQRSDNPTAVVSLLGSLPLFVLAIVAIPVNAFVAWFGNRRSAVLGSVLLGLSQILASFALTNIAALVFLFGPVQGCASALLYLSSVPILSQYFHERRALATGVCYSAAGVGGAVLSIVAQNVIARHGVVWAYRVLGLMSLAICLPASCLIRPKLERLEISALSIRNVLNLDVLRSTPFVLVLVAAAIMAFTLFTPSFFLATFAEAVGYSAQTGAHLSLGYNLASAVGRVLFGFLADYLGEMNSLVMTVSLSGITCFAIWPFAESLTLLALFAVCSGATTGAWYALVPGVCAELLGTVLVGVGLAWLELVGSVGYLAGGPVAGYILDVNGGSENGIEAFRPTMWYVGSAALSAATCIFVGRLFVANTMARRC